MQKVRKAVIPAAGYGTRMLPITKTISKEMLPLVDKPIIQQVVEELVEAGIEDIILVVAAHKADINDYFGDVEAGLKAHLQAAGPSKAQLLEQLEAVQNMANFAFVEQRGVYGTGTPVLNAEPYIGNEPFIFTFADDFFISETNSFRQMIDAYEKYGAPVWGGQKRTADADYDRYGYVGGLELESGIIEVQDIAERPGKDNAPGDLASLGGFVVTPEVMGYLHVARDELEPGKELYFNSALSLMIADGQRVVAKEITGAEYFDTGNKLEYMKTVTQLAARHPEIGDDFRKFLNDFVARG
jgi:UTP--glucose-1-phosphate uridylyltransferase